MPDTTTPLNVSISLPERILLSHWEAYTHARQDYIQRREDSGKTASAVIADYYGALALIRAGFVHVDGSEELTRVINLDDQSATPVEVIGFIVREVSRKVEAALASPLALTPSSSGSSGTSTIQPVTPAPSS